MYPFVRLGLSISKSTLSTLRGERLPITESKHHPLHLPY